MLRTTTLAALLGSVLFAGAALAQAEPDNAIKYRQQVLRALGSGLTGVAMNVKGEVAHPDAVLVHAQTVAANAPLLVPAFEQSTAGEGSAQTKAKADIWANSDEFASLADDMEAAAIELVAVAETGDMAAIGRQLGQVGGTCKACHDKYRD